MPAEAKAPSRAWRDSFEATAYQGFLAGLKEYWVGDLYREVVEAAKKIDAPTPAALETAMRDDASYRLYAWLERRIQQLKWSGRYGFATMVDAQRRELGAALARAESLAPARLRLNPALRLPEYVTATETHQQPGGLWRDPLNAYVLAWYTTGLSFAGTSPDELVDYYAQLIRERCAQIGLAPRAILDMGCTGGRSTRAIKRAIPQATCSGCDVCEGTLRHGHLRAIEENCEITLAQWSAESLGCPDASMDVIASHWLYHEMPPEGIRRSLDEARRVLKPGGLFVAYDMVLVPGGVIGKWLQSGYAARNNEPFAHTLTGFDFRGELGKRGFKDIRLELTSPQHRGPHTDADLPAAMPARRTHYMTFVSAVRN